MKQFVSLVAITLICFFFTSDAYGQGVSLNTTGAAADSSAMLDVSSTSKGVLIPRMTNAQRNAISSPATGLMIYQTDGTPGFYYYTGSTWSAVGGGGSLPSGSAGDILYHNGSAWVSLPAGANGKVLVMKAGVPTWAPTTTLAVGDSYGGGKIGYLLQPGDIGYEPSVQHGLIVSIIDQTTGVGAPWFDGYAYTATYARGTSLGTGLSNTMAMIASIGGGWTYAATLARSYTGGGYIDWYLPSYNELNKLYINKAAIGGFSPGIYWTSTESTIYKAWAQSFSDGSHGAVDKTLLYKVRAVRAF